MSFKMSFVGTCFGLTRPSSGNYQLEESPHCTHSRVSITMLLLHVVVFKEHNVNAVHKNSMREVGAYIDYTD
jgi:hypothetical protein